MNKQDRLRNLYDWRVMDVVDFDMSPSELEITDAIMWEIYDAYEMLKDLRLYKRMGYSDAYVNLNDELCKIYAEWDYFGIRF